MLWRGARPLCVFYFHQPNSRGEWLPSRGLLAIFSQIASVTPGGLSSSPALTSMLVDVFPGISFL